MVKRTKSKPPRVPPRERARAIAQRLKFPSFSRGTAPPLGPEAIPGYKLIMAAMREPKPSMSTIEKWRQGRSAMPLYRFRDLAAYLLTIGMSPADILDVMLWFTQRYDERHPPPEPAEDPAQG